MKLMSVEDIPCSWRRAHRSRAARPRKKRDGGSDSEMKDAKAVSNSTILGAAAEYYVMCQLLRRNMIAALAPAGVPDTDIIVSDRVGSTLAAVQVKARREIGRDGGWHMKARHETISRRLLFYCFVDFGRAITDAPKCWVVPSSVVANVLSVAHEAWLAQPGRGGKAHNDHNMRRLLPNYPRMKGAAGYSTGWLDPYLEAWDSIASASGPA